MFWSVPPDAEHPQWAERRMRPLLRGAARPADVGRF
jgi:hypothetical protein